MIEALDGEQLEQARDALALLLGSHQRAQAWLDHYDYIRQHGGYGTVTAEFRQHKCRRVLLTGGDVCDE